MSSRELKAAPSDSNGPAPETISPEDILKILEEGLKTWYSQISLRYVDLVGDFAGQEFFLLDGEALLQTIFNDPMLDLGGRSGGISYSFPSMVY
jgi:hypothetical protein